jgi:hypothetical protein
MRQLEKLIMVAVIALAAAGCGAVQETRLAPNLVRLDVNPPAAAPFPSDAVMRRAAEVTLQSGYGAFRLSPVYGEAFNDFGVIVIMSYRGAGGYDARAVLGQTPY